jgi:hypothetical protein
LPSPIPSLEVRSYRVDAWLVARDLFKMARKTVQWEKKMRRRRELIHDNPAIVDEGFDGVDIIGEECMQEVLERNFRGFLYQLERQKHIPEEFRIIDLDDSPQRIATQLGSIATKKSLQLSHTINN